MKIVKFSLIALFCFLTLVTAHADDSYHPEANATLEQGKAWTKIDFDQKNETKVIFRVWYPYTPDQVWETLIDTNGWKKNHKDYSDSATLDSSQFTKAKALNSPDINNYYSSIGKSTPYPSDYNRKKGGIWTSYVFQRFNVPWPFKDKWCVLGIKNDESKSKLGQYQYTYEMGGGNFKALKGEWKILPIKDKPGWTEFRGEYITDPGISAPRFITRSIVKSSVQRSTDENMKALQKNGASRAK
jgi:hypothetical protein